MKCVLVQKGCSTYHFWSNLSFNHILHNKYMKLYWTSNKIILAQDLFYTIPYKLILLNW